MIRSRYRFAWALVGLLIALFSAIGLSACSSRVVVVRCDYAVMPVGAVGITAADSVSEAWRDSAVCDLRTRAALSGGRL